MSLTEKILKELSQQAYHQAQAAECGERLKVLFAKVTGPVKPKKEKPGKTDWVKFSADYRQSRLKKRA